MLALRLVHGALGGAISAIIAGMALAIPWLGSVQGIEPSRWGWPAVLVGLGAVAFVAAQVHDLRKQHLTISPQLRVHRSIVAVYGTALIGAGIAVVSLWAIFRLTVPAGSPGSADPANARPTDGTATDGTATGGTGTDAVRAWTAAYGLVYWLPVALAVVFVIAGVIALVVGLRDIDDLKQFNAERTRRRRAGRHVTGRIVAADALPGRPDLTRLVAEFSMPDGPTRVTVTVPGSRRAGLVGAKADLQFDPAHPDNPDGILTVQRSRLRQTFLLDEPVTPVTAW